MGNYYCGMMHNKDGYGELKHYRTKGSRNGYSTTPGYVAIGEKAVDRDRLKRMITNAVSRTIANKLGIHQINMASGSNTGRTQAKRPMKYSEIKKTDNPLRKAIYNSPVGDTVKRYESNVSNIAKSIGPIASAYAEETAKGAREIGSFAAKIPDAMMRYGKQAGQDIGNTAGAVVDHFKSLPEYIRESQQYYRDHPEERDAILNRDSRKEKWKTAAKIVNSVGRAMGEAYNRSRHGEDRDDTDYARNYVNEIEGLPYEYTPEEAAKAKIKARQRTQAAEKHNKLRKKYIETEKYYQNMQKKYDAAVKRRDFDMIERLESQLNKAADKYIKAQNDFHSFSGRTYG